MNVDRDMVLHIAQLAKLELQESEIDLFVKQLGDILQYIEQLNEASGTADPFSFSFFLPSVTRPDIAGESLSVEEALKNAPERYKQFFKVPKIIP
ncbi:Asp-tRNA(Asn)/Glu-tRNA(Gln) amidotransferase subunit GatC [bacterium]|nr:Asp-tRNA(Asn)/Glu-tRNA(Gln) amidotransferase subunit GatC [bacterium]